MSNIFRIMQMASAGTIGGGSDPYFSNVSLLLHMDGSNGSTTFTDHSPSPKTVTAYGNAQISTAQSVFGGASAYFDGAGDYLTAPSSAAFNFGSGDFVIEGWINPSNGTQMTVAERRGTGFSSGDWVLFIQEAGVANKISFYAYDINSSVAVLSATSATISGWTHVAISRSGATFRAFVGGVLVASATSSAAIADNSQPLTIGRDNVSGGRFYWNGYIDDLRITKGVARYTSDFTPPTAAFPDS